MAYAFQSIQDQYPRRAEQSGMATQQPGTPQPVEPQPQQPEQKDVSKFTKAKGSVGQAIVQGSTAEASKGAINQNVKQMATTQSGNIQSAQQAKANAYTQGEQQRQAEQQTRVMEGSRDTSALEGSDTQAANNKAAQLQQFLNEQYQAGDFDLANQYVDQGASQDIGSYLQKQKAKEGYTAGQAAMDSALFGIHGGGADVINQLSKSQSEIDKKRSALLGEEGVRAQAQKKGQAGLSELQGGIKSALQKIIERQRGGEGDAKQDLENRALAERQNTLKQMEEQYGDVIKSTKQLKDPNLEQIRQRYGALKNMGEQDYLGSVGLGLGKSESDIRTQEQADRLNRIQNVLGIQGRYGVGNRGAVEQAIGADRGLLQSSLNQLGLYREGEAQRQQQLGQLGEEIKAAQGQQAAYQQALSPYEQYQKDKMKLGTGAGTGFGETAAQKKQREATQKYGGTMGDAQRFALSQKREEQNQRLADLMKQQTELRRG